MIDKFLAYFISYLTMERGLAANSVQAYRRDLEDFLAYLQACGITNPAEVTRDTISEYLEFEQPGLYHSPLDRRAGRASSIFHKNAGGKAGQAISDRQFQRERKCL